MTAGELGWLKQGKGQRPQPAWSFATEAPLVGLRLARETGEILAADASGGLYHLDRQGQLIGVTHGPSPVRSISWSETGNGGIALVGEEKLYWFDRQLAFQGWSEPGEPILAAALEAHGRYAAISLSSSSTVLYDAHRKVVRRFTTMQPLNSIEFFIHQPALLGVTEFGSLCSYHFSGEPLWHEQLFAHVGDLSVTGDGQTILLACYLHGIQCHNGRGVQSGSYQVGGTVVKVSTGFVGGRIAAATQERHFYYMDTEGKVIWQGTLPEDVCRLTCEPMGRAVICGFQSGRIVCLEWT
jgi:hypothetical protein